MIYKTIIKYEKIEKPDQKFNSCVEGRILTVFNFLTGQKKRTSDLYLFLCQCALYYDPITTYELEHMTDFWYYQPLGLSVKNEYSISSDRGFCDLGNFMKRYGVFGVKKHYFSENELLNHLIVCLKNEIIPIALIDQFNFRKSDKYHKQKDAIHALLLYGIDLEKEMFWVLDSGNKGEYTISFDELIEASVNDVIYMGKIKNQQVIEEGHERPFFSPFENMKMEIISCHERIKFLMEIKNLALSKDKYIAYGGCSVTIKYRVLPYFVKSCRTMPECMNNILYELEINWELLSKILLKIFYCERLNSEIGDLILRLLRTENLYLDLLKTRGIRIGYEKANP